MSAILVVALAWASFVLFIALLLRSAQSYSFCGFFAWFAAASAVPATWIAVLVR